MTLTIGRLSVAAPTSITHSGDRVSLTFNILPATLAEAKVRRQQVLGLADNPDEPVVPVTWSDDSDYDGFYRVASALVEPTSVYLTQRLMRASVELERVGGGYALPPQEIVVKHVVTSVDRVWVPSAFTWQAIGDTLSARATETGAVTGFDVSAATTTLPGAYTIAPSDLYDGAATVEMQVGGVWYPVVGRQTPASASLRISNGVIRVTPGTGPTLLEVWDGSAWDSVGSFHAAGVWSSTPTNEGSGEIGAHQVLMNSVTNVAIVVDINEGGRWTLGLARGELFFTARYERPAYQASLDVIVGASASTAITALSGPAVRQTSNGATGHMWLIEPATNPNLAEDVTDGNITLTTPDDLVAIGVILNGSGAVAPNTETDLRAQIASRIAQRQIVVSR